MNFLLKGMVLAFWLMLLHQGEGFSQKAKYSNEFLTIGVGAKALGMAGAQVASATDVTAAYWNPSGLTGIPQGFEAGLMHASFFAGLSRYDYLGFATGINENEAIAFSVIRVGVDDIPNTIELIDSEGNFDYSRIKRFSVADYGFLFSYARRAGPEGMSLGGTIKIIYRGVGEFARAWGFGIDAAARYVRKDWSYGIILRDLTSTINVWSFNEEKLEISLGDSLFNLAPDEYLELTIPSITAGISRLFKLNDKYSVMAESNLYVTFDGRRSAPLRSSLVSIDPSIGLEASYLQMVFLRAGAGKFQQIPGFGAKKNLSVQPSIGLGFRFNRFSIDYCLTGFGQGGVSMYSNIFSLKYSFLKKQA
jgi:hypothetical protein